MTPELSVALYYCGAEGWQYDWLGSFDGPLTFRLCLHQLPCVCGTTDYLPRLCHIVKFVLIYKMHHHVSNDSAY